MRPARWWAARSISARRSRRNLGLKPDFVESAFAAVIPTLQAKQCDVIMAQLYIKPEREKVVDFVPYVYSGTGIAVSKDHPADITGLDDSMCGKKVIVAVATTAESLSQEQSDKCTAGRQAGRRHHPQQPRRCIPSAGPERTGGRLPRHRGIIGLLRDEDRCPIQMAGQPFGTIKIGAATLKGNTVLHNAIQDALNQVEADGTYNKILDAVGSDRPEHPEVIERS